MTFHLSQDDAEALREILRRQGIIMHAHYAVGYLHHLQTCQLAYPDNPVSTGLVH